jgi:hypothetical protein
MPLSFSFPLAPGECVGDIETTDEVRDLELESAELPDWFGTIFGTGFVAMNGSVGRFCSDATSFEELERRCLAKGRTGGTRSPVFPLPLALPLLLLRSRVLSLHEFGRRSFVKGKTGGVISN